MKKTMSLKAKIILSVISGIILTSVYFYVSLPAINPMDPSFWGSLALVIAFFAYPFLLVPSKPGKKKSKAAEQIIKFKGNTGDKTVNIYVCIAIFLPLLILLIGNMISSTFFNAKAYAGVITVKEAVFAEDMKETNEVTNIALMDSTSAQTIGNRTLGSLSDVVSQYEIAETYTQINYGRTPKKVANLEYADFFKWINNMEKGIPGYVMVDPVNNSAEYMKLDKPLKYVDSAFFDEDLMRKLRFSYPTKIFDWVSFEIDENGDPYYIVSCVQPKVFPFGAMDVVEVIIFDPCTGESNLYPIAETPAWVDCAFSGTLAEQKYNWHGTLSGGFWNSVIGNKDCKKTTDDFGYIVIDDDVWYFTGVTSVTSDESNIGFIISNARTGEYKYYPVVGAEEYSAMRAAEGEVQEKGYTASFPSLINVDGQATYILVLKDSGGLVKLYALVNVEQYSIVATGSTQTEAMAAYKALLLENGIVEEEKEPEQPADQLKTAKIEITEIKSYTVDGNTVFYITSGDGVYYKAALRDFEELIFLGEGANVTVTYKVEDAEKKIIDVVKLEIK